MVTEGSAQSLAILRALQLASAARGEECHSIRCQPNAGMPASRFAFAPISVHCFCKSVRISGPPHVPGTILLRYNIWLKNLILKMSYTLFYNKLYCKSQTHLTWILGVHVYNSSNAFNVNEFSQKRNVRKRN